MKNKVFFWQLAGFVFTSVAGILLHFAYDWSNQSPFIASFAAVNESIWEHMKLLFFPMFLYAAIENLVLGEKHPNFWCTKLFGISLGLLLIPVLYYSYTGIFGIQKDWINIVIFFLANAVSYLTEGLLFRKRTFKSPSPAIALFFLCLFAFGFVIFTFMPPQIPLFQESFYPIQ